MLKLKKIYIALAVSLLSSVAANASIDQARTLLRANDFSAALQMATEDIVANPKGADVPELQLIAGQACVGMSEFAKAREWFNKSKTKLPDDSYLGLARADMLQYRFEDAAKNYAKVKGNRGEEGREQAMLAEEFMDRVQKVAIVDTICVDANRFFEAYELSSGAGKITAPTEGVDGSTVYNNEAGNLRIYAKKGASGFNQLVRADLLGNGEWEETVLRFGGDDNEDDDNDSDFDFDFDIDYPYLMSDGVTLYLAHNGPGGIGGYDIYVANGDPLSEKYMNPGNLGMPFNSPANDYMMVVDEETGLGWWVTDRHHRDGKSLTIYVYAPADVRINYPTDDPDIERYARGIKWSEDADANERYRALDSGEL